MRNSLTRVKRAFFVFQSCFVSDNRAESRILRDNCKIAPAVFIVPSQSYGNSVGEDIILPHKMAILPNLEVANHLITRFRGSFPSRGSLASVRM